MVQDRPAVRVLLVDIRAAEDQQANGLEAALCLEGFDGFKEGKGTEDGLLFVDLLAAGEQEVHLPGVSQLGSLAEIEYVAAGEVVVGHFNEILSVL